MAKPKSPPRTWEEVIERLKADKKGKYDEDGQTVHGRRRAERVEKVTWLDKSKE